MAIGTIETNDVIRIRRITHSRHRRRATGGGGEQRDDHNRADVDLVEGTECDMSNQVSNIAGTTKTRTRGEVSTTSTMIVVPIHAGHYRIFVHSFNYYTIIGATCWRKARQATATYGGRAGLSFTRTVCLALRFEFGREASYYYFFGFHNIIVPAKIISFKSSPETPQEEDGPTPHATDDRLTR